MVAAAEERPGMDRDPRRAGRGNEGAKETTAICGITSLAITDDLAYSPK